MPPVVDFDWLSLLLITGMAAPALGATVFGYLVLRRRGSLPARPTPGNPRAQGTS